jgi:hypothetical protein
MFGQTAPSTMTLFSVSKMSRVRVPLPLILFRPHEFEPLTPYPDAYSNRGSETNPTTSTLFAVVAV